MATPENSEKFEFFNAAELLQWLKQFKETDLDAVCFKSANGVTLDCIAFHHEESLLTDGSTVHDIRVVV